MSYLQKGETYKVDVARLTADGTEHPHIPIRGSHRDVHTVTVLHANAHHHVSVECECGAQWIFKDTGSVGDARYRLTSASLARRNETNPPGVLAIARKAKRGGYGRRAR